MKFDTRTIRTRFLCLTRLSLENVTQSRREKCHCECLARSPLLDSSPPPKNVRQSERRERCLRTEAKTVPSPEHPSPSLAPISSGLVALRVTVFFGGISIAIVVCEVTSFVILACFKRGSKTWTASAMCECEARTWIPAFAGMTGFVFSLLRRFGSLHELVFA